MLDYVRQRTDGDDGLEHDETKLKKLGVSTEILLFGLRCFL